MTDPSAWITALRHSHDALSAVLAPLGADQVTAQSYASEWTVADVASHLGSGAEIFGLILAKGQAGEPAPGGEAFVPIWDRWNATPPAEQVSGSIAANEAFVSSLEALTPEQKDSFAMHLFGAQQDLSGLLSMRLGEHAVHAWDIEVALDPSATVSAEAVGLLIDTLGRTAGRGGKPIDDGGRVTVHTTAPERLLLLTLSPEVSLDETDVAAEDALTLPAEQFLRLVYGRLDAAGGEDPRLAELRRVFPGF
jgi:uncharacterized protein (TIGR03083 family)